jgi:hypothetical protein
MCVVVLIEVLHVLGRGTTGVFSGFSLLPSLPHTVTAVSHLWIMHRKTILYCLSKKLTDITEIHHPELVQASHLAVYQLVLAMLPRFHAKEITLV